MLRRISFKNVFFVVILLSSFTLLFYHLLVIDFLFCCCSFGISMLGDVLTFFSFRLIYNQFVCVCECFIVNLILSGDNF